MAEHDSTDVSSIPTGSVGLDRAIGVGGYPLGRIVEIYGPEFSGKTTLALHAIAQCQAQGGTAALIDAEHALDLAYAEQLGVKLDDLLVAQSDCGEQGLDITEQLVNSGEVSLIVIDSVAALVPRVELDGEVGDHHVGLQARMMSKAMRKLVGPAMHWGTCIIFINQLRKKTGVTFGSGEVTAGGNALKFYASLRLDVRRVEPITRKDVWLGVRTRVRVVKNKLAPPFEQTEFDILCGYGICSVGELIDRAMDLNIVQKKEDGFVWNDNNLGQGREAVRQHLIIESDLAATLRSAVADAELSGSVGSMVELEAPMSCSWPLLEPVTPFFLRSLFIRHFRGLVDFDLKDLGRVNLLVGANNVGKTSVLEALYILSRLSDPRGLLDTLRLRTGQDLESNSTWLRDLVSTLKIDLVAFDSDGHRVSVCLDRPSVLKGTDLTTYISGMRFHAVVNAIPHTTDTALFSDRSRRTIQVAGRSRWLAPAVLYSSVARLDRATLVHWYEASVDAGSLHGILDVLRDAVDSGIQDVRLVSQSGRFMVKHQNCASMDLVCYGEGVQRVFEIGLLFAAHKGGLVLIDGLETAIFTGALVQFTKMIHQFACVFDVQVFLTTHSKEVVDAFILNEYHTEGVVAYLLSRTNTGVRSWRYDGPILKSVVEVGDVDIRRLG